MQETSKDVASRESGIVDPKETVKNLRNELELCGSGGRRCF